MQMEGSGVKPDDVTVDAGNLSSGDGSPIEGNSGKDVGIRVDRADGFVLRNLKVRHAKEHDVYEIETDGFLLDRVKMAYAGEYGLLTFVADHNLIQNCDAWGNGDSGIYPGAAAEGAGNEGAGTNVPMDQRRYGTEIRNCDSHHNAGGYSGTDGNSVWIHHNNFYDNTLGFTTDVFTAPGHPGFPQDSDLIENNNFYDNNFNTYLAACPGTTKPGPNGPNQGCSDVVPTVPSRSGPGSGSRAATTTSSATTASGTTGAAATMLFTVPDAARLRPGGQRRPVATRGLQPRRTPSTSYGNEFYANEMGLAPDGSPQPNGTDFWWDDFAGNTGNCWHDNTGVDGTAASVTSDPTGALLPSNCATSLGLGVGNPLAEPELLGCFAAFSQGVGSCDWFTTPTKP